MNEEFLDQRTAVLAAATAVTLCDAIGYKAALTDLPVIEGYSAGADEREADKAVFTGSGVAN